MANANTRTPQQQNQQPQRQSPQQQNALRGGQQDRQPSDLQGTGQKHMDQGQSSLNKDDQGRSQS
jgi:hypothetical protein